MNINVNSWHYKLYCWSYDVWNSTYYIPTHTNLCQYVQRIFWIPLLTALFYGFIGSMYVVCIPVFLIFGVRPINIFSAAGYDEPFPKYRGLFGFLYPWHLFVVAGIVWLQIHEWHAHASAMAAAYIAIGSIIFVAVGLWFGFGSKSETAILFRLWIGSKKDSICPLVSFSDAPTDGHDK